MKKCDILIYLFFMVMVKCYRQFIIPNDINMIRDSIVNNCCNRNRNVYIYAKKKNRKVIVIECTEARKYGKQPSRYVTEKNKVNTPKKLQLYKYNKYLKRRTLHVEIK
ncbi:50S ribosomal protein L33, putative [Plasmodium malariae]|uniref:50S ribosomal protein L33, putative n=1 Tax=Plasmodium malariae TaxID=5858 RepID=A0A1D3TEM0_PLAMA|nr:50S ribosomal protein L33, putative [Plasmodium malariae]SCP03405.1 50S ribosomal protein L33, putative [Plasmodium malariae]